MVVMPAIIPTPKPILSARSNPSADDDLCPAVDFPSSDDPSPPGKVVLLGLMLEDSAVYTVRIPLNPDGEDVCEGDCGIEVVEAREVGYALSAPMTGKGQKQAKSDLDENQVLKVLTQRLRRRIAVTRCLGRERAVVIRRRCYIGCRSRRGRVRVISRRCYIACERRRGRATIAIVNRHRTTDVYCVRITSRIDAIG